MKAVVGGIDLATGLRMPSSWQRNLVTRKHKVVAAKDTARSRVIQLAAAHEAKTETIGIKVVEKDGFFGVIAEKTMALRKDEEGR